MEGLPAGVWLLHDDLQLPHALSQAKLAGHLCRELARARWTVDPSDRQHAR